MSFTYQTLITCTVQDVKPISTGQLIDAMYVVLIDTAGAQTDHSGGPSGKGPYTQTQRWMNLDGCGLGQRKKCSFLITFLKVNEVF